MAHAPTAGFSLLASVSRSACVSIRTFTACVGARTAGITGANASMLGAMESAIAMVKCRDMAKNKRGGIHGTLKCGKFQLESPKRSADFLDSFLLFLEPPKKDHL